MRLEEIMDKYEMEFTSEEVAVFNENEASEGQDETSYMCAVPTISRRY